MGIVNGQSNGLSGVKAFRIQVKSKQLGLVGRPTDIVVGRIGQRPADQFVHLIGGLLKFRDRDVVPHADRRVGVDADF